MESVTIDSHDRRPLRIDVITPYLPDVGRAGHSQYLASVTTALVRSGADVRLVLIDPWPAPLVSTVPPGVVVVGPGIVQRGRRVVVTTPRRLAVNLVATVVDRVSPRAARAAFSLRSRLRRRLGVDQTLFRPLRPKTAAWVSELLRGDPERVVLINGHGLGTDTVPAETPIGVITHDSIAARCARLHRGGYLTSPATFTDGDERALLVRARLVSAIQLDDVERFRSQCSHAEVTWLPPSFRVEDASWKRPPVGMSCLFVGSASLPNVDGLNWFLDSVWPIVMARRPDAVLRVVGSVCDRVRHRPGVELLGRVRDLDLEYSRTRMCVVPLRVGSGLKIKTAEAIAHHRPLVTTSIGAEGLPRGTRESMLVCDDAVTFAEAVLLLLAEEAVRQRLIAATGRSAPLFDTNRFAEPFIASLHRLNHTRA